MFELLEYFPNSIKSNPIFVVIAFVSTVILFIGIYRISIDMAFKLLILAFEFIKGCFKVLERVLLHTIDRMIFRFIPSSYNTDIELLNLLSDRLFPEDEVQVLMDSYTKNRGPLTSSELKKYKRILLEYLIKDREYNLDKENVPPVDINDYLYKEVSYPQGEEEYLSK